MAQATGKKLSLEASLCEGYGVMYKARRMGKVKTFQMMEMIFQTILQNK